jgi:hypothetical protein
VNKQRNVFRRMSVVVGLTAVLTALVLTGSAATGTTTKAYTANICAGGPCVPPVTPPTLAGGATATVALTIANQANTQSLGSMNVTAPAGFTVTGVATLPSGSSFSGGLITLRNLNLASGSSRTFTITVSVPCQPPASSAWAITAKQSNDFNGPPGNNFTLVQPSSLTTPVTGACKLVIVTPPTNAQVGKTITSVAYDPAAAPVKVEVHDGSNALVSSATGSVTLTASSNASSFSGTTSSLSGGVATFPSLKSSTAGTYTLTASGAGFASSDASNSFKIGSKLVFLAQPQDAKTGTTITSADLDPNADPVQVAVVPPDAVAPYTPIASATGSVTLAPSPTGSFTGTTASFSSGVASFSALKGTVTGTYTVTATDQSSSTAATSDPFVIADFGTICPAGDTTCTGTTSSSDKKTNASVTSTTPSGFDEPTTLEITMLAAGPPAGACAGFTPAPGSNGVSVDVRPQTDLTEITITLDKSIVNVFPENGAAHFNVCFGGKIATENPAVTPFPTKPGTPAAQLIDGLFWGILPDCSGTPTTPCVKSKNKTGSGKAVIVFDVPNPWDLRGYTG